MRFTRSAISARVPAPTAENRAGLAMPTAVVHRRANGCQHGWVSHPVAMEVADIKDALTLWRRRSVPSAGPQPQAVAVDAFRRLHRGGEAGALDSALLLCTDRQWHTASAKVIAGIVDSGILDDDDQDRLADTLLWNERVLCRHPILVDRHHLCRIFFLDSPAPGRTMRVDANTPTTAHRSVWPPLRPGPLAVSSLDAEHQCATSSNTHGRCQRAMRPPR